MTSIYMETTRIGVDKTVSEIEKILARYGANQILKEYESGEIVSVKFLYKKGETQIPFYLPCRWERLAEVLKEEGKRPKYDDTYETWAKRVAWRQILRWIEAQMAMVATRMVDFVEVFLPYACNKNGQTAYQLLEKGGFKALTYGNGKK